MTTTRTVAITGATGFVGRHIVRALIGRGHRVRALIRDRVKAQKVLPAASNENLMFVTGDALDPASLAELLRGADACVNTVGIIRQTPGRTFRRMHVEATRLLAQACRSAKVTRFVQISALGVSDVGKTAYQKTKFEAEMILRRSDLDWTILRPGMIIGGEGEFTQMVASWARGASAPWFFLPYFTRGREDTSVPLGPVVRTVPRIAPVAVEDVAAAVAAALERPASIGEIYNLVGGEELTWPEFLRHVRDTVPNGEGGLRPMGLPAEIAAAAAACAGAVGLGKLVPFDAGMAIMGGEDAVGSTEKARAELGLIPRAFREAFAGVAASLA